MVEFGIGNEESSIMWYVDWLGKGPIRNMVPFFHIAGTTLKMRDNQWRLEELRTILPKDIHSMILNKPGPSSQGADYWLQKYHASGKYFLGRA